MKPVSKSGDHASRRSSRKGPNPKPIHKKGGKLFILGRSKQAQAAIFAALEDVQPDVITKENRMELRPDNPRPANRKVIPISPDHVRRCLVCVPEGQPVNNFFGIFRPSDEQAGFIQLVAEDEIPNIIYA